MLGSGPIQRQSGVRSGVILALATAASILAAHTFQLAAGRVLGREDNGSLAALLGFLSIILIPAGALQMAVSREVSRSLATGDPAGAARLARGALRAALIAFFHSGVSNLISAGIRAVPLGQTAGQRILASLQSAVIAAADDALARHPDDVGSAAPMIEWTSIRHETQYTRLFRS